jgi:hypothetical protein
VSYSTDRECLRRRLQEERAKQKPSITGVVPRGWLAQQHMVRTGRWFRWDWECPHVTAWGYAPKVYADPVCELCKEVQWEKHPHTPLGAPNYEEEVES